MNVSQESIIENAALKSQEQCWTRRALLNEGERKLREAGIDAPRRNVVWMLCEVLRCERAQLFARPAQPVAPAQVDRLAAMLVRRAAREPLQYVLGHAAFYGLRVKVTPNVLIPRPETEQVVEAALCLVAEHNAPRVLDVGTGTGCIALALKHEWPEAEVFACDVSAAALSVAAENAEAHRLGVSLFQADVLEDDFTRRAPNELDLLISNPPYLADDEAEALSSEVRDHEPRLALFAGRDPLRFYRVIARRAARLLTPGGMLVFEAHAEHDEAVRRLLAETEWADVRLKHDLAGRPRIVTARRQTRHL